MKMEEFIIIAIIIIDDRDAVIDLDNFMVFVFVLSLFVDYWTQICLISFFNLRLSRFPQMLKKKKVGIRGYYPLRR